MYTVNAYLNFMGNTEEAMNFYQSVFGGTFSRLQRYKDLPGSEKMPADVQHKIIHMSLAISNGTTIMATDSLASMEEHNHFSNNIHLCIQAETETEAEDLFVKLSKGGKVEMPMNKTFWGAYFGMCQDKYGVHWMINFDYPIN
ncbi:VOC family protein [Solitalea lacus]|uniref:VOC family protein n=1 Tax=Solitalea lacus TaxID=2911172 RepID=UPI001EDC1CBF|nr:VOC family protein [Solitalea lacus]UKJ08540.1 VOC family protein [Solitalea lacus]